MVRLQRVKLTLLSNSDSLRTSMSLTTCLYLLISNVDHGRRTVVSPLCLLSSVRSLCRDRSLWVCFDQVFWGGARATGVRLWTVSNVQPGTFSGHRQRWKHQPTNQPTSGEGQRRHWVSLEHDEDCNWEGEASWLAKN